MVVVREALFEESKTTELKVARPGFKRMLELAEESKTTELKGPLNPLFFLLPLHT